MGLRPLAVIMRTAIFDIFLWQLLFVGYTRAASGHVGQPSLYQSPRFRWWWPGGWADADEVRAEITDIIDAGFGGGEIGDVEDSVKVALDPKIYGWGQDRWNSAVLSAYQTAVELGGHVDYTLGPHWPTGFPGYTPDSPSTMKELVHGQVFVSAGQTFQGDLPLPVAAPSGNETGNVLPATPKAYLAAVVAAQTSTTDQNASVVDIDPSTVQVLTDLVTTNSTTISWTAPSNGTWVLVAAYGRGTGQIQNMYDGNPEAPKVTYPFPAYIVDHFSAAGVEAGVKYWSEHLLSDELLPLVAQANGSIFEDSLELKMKQYWTLNFMEEFQQRRGYDLSPFLFYVIKDTNTFSGDSTVSAQIVNDFYQTVSDLYTDYRLGGLKTWANSIGMKLRVQPYTLSADSGYAASVVDIPEGESLGFDGDNDAFRVLATGRDIGGKTTILSDELGAYMGLAYGVEWDFILGTANLDMALGVSQVVIHGYPYRDSPDSLWPGFAPFTPLGTNSNGFADAWGSRQPHWMFARNASAYLAYAQKLLQEGGPSIDVAILNEAWGVAATWSDSSLNDAGYSYQFPTSKLLAEYNATVEDGRLVAQGPAYKTLIVDQTSMDVSDAQTILSYGESGLPIVLVGSSAPNSTFSYSATVSQAAAVEELSQLWSQIEALNTTQTVTSAAEVPDTLAALGVQPSVQYSNNTNTSLITHRRTMDSGFLYWIYNNADDTIENQISLEGTGAPYQINLWTGDVTPIPAFTVSGGYVTFNISLVSTAALAVYVGTTNPFDAPVLTTHLVSSSCESFVDDGTIYIQSSGAACEATTSNTTVVSLSPESLPSPVSPSSWTLNVEDWAPAVINETGLNSSRTTKTQLPPVSLSSLAPWPNITALADIGASGIGIYNTTVSLSASPADLGDVRVYLSVGTVVGSYAVSVNGKSVGSVDWFGGTDIDVTDLAVSGSNDIQVTVATTLWNKLIKVWPAVYGSDEPQDIGLLGPVVVYYSSVQAVA